MTKELLCKNVIVCVREKEREWVFFSHINIVISTWWRSYCACSNSRKELWRIMKRLGVGRLKEETKDFINISVSNGTVDGQKYWVKEPKWGKKRERIHIILNYLTLLQPLKEEITVHCMIWTRNNKWREWRDKGESHIISSNPYNFTAILFFAGLTAETSTGSIIIDSTAPVFNGQPQIDGNFGSLVQNTQVKKHQNCRLYAQKKYFNGSFTMNCRCVFIPLFAHIVCLVSMYTF